MKKCKNFVVFNNDNEFDAYFLGFIQTDGTLTRKRITVEIHVRDQHILETFMQRIGGSIRQRTRNTTF